MKARRKARHFWCVLASAFSVALFSTPPRAGAQLPGLSVPAEHPPPARVRRIGLSETTNVEFEGVPLFEITSRLVADHGNPGAAVPVEVRAVRVENHLAKLLAVLAASDTGKTRDDPTAFDTGDAEIRVTEQSGQVALTVRAGALPGPRNLITVTTIDAERQQTPRRELGEQWRRKIVSALSDAIRERRPDALRERYRTLQQVAVVLIVSQIVLFALGCLIVRRQERLRTVIKRQKAALRSGGSATLAPPPTAPEDGHAADATEARNSHILRLFGQEMSLEARFRFLAFLHWFVFWMICAIWTVSGVIVLFEFPQTRKVAIYLATTPLLGMVALFLAGLVNRITDFAVDRSLAAWQANRLLDGADAVHAAARVSTLSGVIRALKYVVIYGVAVVWILSRLDVIPWSVLTLGAILALAVSFAAQSLIKDVVSGALILSEDQFSVGDYVAVQDVTGTVEYMNLRITQVRTADGRLVTVPNSTITKVENFNRDWSVAVVTFDVPRPSDADAALEKARGLAREMAREPEWDDAILDAVQWSGVSNLSRATSTLEIAVRTRPLKHWAVGRELRRRIQHALGQ